MKAVACVLLLVGELHLEITSRQTRLAPVFASPLDIFCTR